MELREFAERVLHGDTINEKLWLPEGGIDALTDVEPGSAVHWSEPGRPVELQIASRKARKKLPALTAMDQPQMRVRVLHTFANHELMALELMAWALLAYPEAGPAFRRGLAHILADEQRHLQLYMDRIAAHGAAFGDLPVNDHFWRCAPSLTTPLKWVSAMSLVFEQANLDFAPVFGRQFELVGDVESAELMKVIERDEIHHVGFGAHFLKQHTPAGTSTYDVWVQNLTFHNSPERARGTEFNIEARLESGLDEEFVARIRDSLKR